MIMRKGIHPDYKETTITCVCGAKYITKSIVKNKHVEICAKCHPFYTGNQVYVDTAGRIERFKEKYKIKQAPGSKKASKDSSEEPKEHKEVKEPKEPKAHKEHKEPKEHKEKKEPKE
jgi:large subunit ribosomal protein L31